MRLRPLVRACIGLFALPVCSLVAQDHARAAASFVAAAASSSSVEAPAAFPVPLLDSAPATGFAPWLVPSVDRLMKEAIQRGVAPGAAVVIGHRGRIVLAKGWGKTDRARGAPAATDETLWDLASVTKVAGTTVAAMLLVDDGALDLDASVGAYLTEWPGAGARGRITVRDLLRHTSGLPAGAPVGEGGPAGLIDRLARLPLRSEPGAAERYGDLDMVLLGAVLERVAGEPLDRLLERRVYRRLGMSETAYRPLDAGIELARIAPTEKVKGRLIHGVVHDPIARGLGGVAGNAGLFASARDLGQLASALLWESPTRVVCRAVVRAFTTRSPGGDYALGWETAAPGTSWGEILDASAFGHVGYTGTSLWIDPAHDVFVVLLANRVNPSARNQKHLALRRDLHQLVMRGLVDADEPAPAPPDGCVAEFRARERALAQARRDSVVNAIRSLPPVRWLH